MATAKKGSQSRKAVKTTAKKNATKTTLWGDVRHPRPGLWRLARPGGRVRTAHPRACPALDLPAYLQARGGGSAEAAAGRLADRVDEGDPDVIDALDLLLWELCHSARPARSTPETARAMRPVLKDMVREEWGPNSEWA